MNKSKRIELLRRSINYSQRDMADQLGISVATYNAYEQDPDRIKLGTLEKMAELFGIPVAQIFLTNDVNDIQIGVNE